MLHCERLKDESDGQQCGDTEKFGLAKDHATSGAVPATPTIAAPPTAKLIQKRLDTCAFVISCR